MAFTTKVCDSSGKHGNPGPLSSVLEVVFKERLSEPHCQPLKPGMEPRAEGLVQWECLANRRKVTVHQIEYHEHYHLSFRQK